MPASLVRHLHWLHIQLLVVLLADQASCNQTSASPSPLSLGITNAQTSVCYFLDVTVDVNGNKKNESEIKAWLREVFQNLNCIATNHKETTATPTSSQTISANTSYETTIISTATTLQSNNITTAATPTALESNNTTTAATPTALESNNTTTAATPTVLESNNTTTAATPTVLESNNTTTAATPTALESNNTTTAATPTALESNNTTTAATPTALESNNTTTAATPTALESNNTTTAATPTALESNNTTTAATSVVLNIFSTTTITTNQFTTATPMQNNSPTVFLPDSSVITQTPDGGGQKKPTKNSNSNQSKKLRIARQISDNVTPISGISNDKTTGLFQGIEVSCDMKTAITKTNCAVTLQLKQTIPPCCILSTLSAANKTEIHVVGKKADTIIPLQKDCNNNTQAENSCTLCEVSGTTYVVPQSNSTQCGAGMENNNNSCSCSAYCNSTDAYYTFEMSIQDPQMNFSYVSSLISKIKHPRNCTPSTDFSCPLSIIASEYKGGNVTCESTTTILQSCSVILGFAHEVPICAVSAAVMNVFQSEKQISYNGEVVRAALCENSEVIDKSLNFQLTWDKVNLKPANFCTTVKKQSNILKCQNGKNVVVQLEEKCVTTPGPNVTTANVTSSPLNTTALNATTTAASVTTLNTTALNATTAAANVTTLNTTALNATTAAANVTTLNTTVSSTHESVSGTTESADSQANALLELTRDVSKLNSSQVDQLVSQLENLLSGPTVSLALGNTSVHVVSNLLGASPETLSNSSHRIIGIVDTVALKLVLAKEAQTLLSLAVALSVKPADGNNFQETFFSISDPNHVEVRGDPRLRRSVTTDSSVPQGSIRLPPSLTKGLTSEEQQLASRVQFNFYQKSTVFQDRSLKKRKLNSGILGASVANLSITGLQDDVEIHLRHIEPIPGNFVATCVFWDFTFNDGSGGWNPNGCSVRNSTESETVCGCNHLTSFAILLDLSREPVTSRLQANILTFITYIGCGVSAIFLSITLLTYLTFEKLRKDIPSKILIQLCLALLLLNLVFLVDAWLALYPQAVGLCISTAWFLHYFLLVSFTWMGLEAVQMYLALVKVFNNYISHYMVKFSLVGWGVPMIVVIIVIAVDKNNYGLVSYGKFADGTSDEFCWLKNDIAFYVAVVAYFCVIFLFNIIMFIMVLVQLCRIKRQNPHNVHHRTTLQDVRSVTGITILLGLTWGFAFFAWGPVNLPFMYLFAIFNSLQGFFIFVFHCAVKENVRKQWRIYLCCGRMRLAENSEWSRTATQKTVKKSSVTRLTSLHFSKSSQSNNSSSSTSLVSDSSEQINSIGSPFEDRAITADEEPSMDVVLNEINRQYRTQQVP